MIPNPCGSNRLATGRSTLTASCSMLVSLLSLFEETRGVEPLRPAKDIKLFKSHKRAYASLRGRGKGPDFASDPFP